MTLTVTLPWPSPDLSPNGRAHWADKARKTKAMREAAGYAAIEAGALRARDDFAGHEPILLHWTFRPGPRQRKADDDNLVASMKAARDGIAQVLQVDDARFRATMEVGPRAKVAHVIATLTSGDTWQRVGDVAANMQKRLAIQFARDMKKDGDEGAGNATRPLTIGALDGRTRSGC